MERIKQAAKAAIKSLPDRNEGTYPYGVQIIREGLAIALNYRRVTKKNLAMVPKRYVLFINLGAIHTSGTLAYFEQRESHLKRHEAGIANAQVTWGEAKTEIIFTRSSLALIA